MSEGKDLAGLRTGLFNAKELAKLVEQVVPEDRTNAVVGTVDVDGIAVVVKMTKGTHWTVEGAFKRDWGGDVTTGAKCIYSW